MDIPSTSPIWLIHTIIQQKLTQHCKAIILQFKKRKKNHKDMTIIKGSERSCKKKKKMQIKPLNRNSWRRKEQTSSVTIAFYVGVYLIFHLYMSFSHPFIYLCVFLFFFGFNFTLASGSCLCSQAWGWVAESGLVLLHFCSVMGCMGEWYKFSLDTIQNLNWWCP